MLRKWWPATLKALFVVGILFFALRTLPLQASDLIAFLTHADYRFYLSMVLFAVFLMLQANIWVLIVNSAGVKTVRGGEAARLGLLQGLRIFINSQFAKYLPGGFWNYAGRIVLTTRAGVSLPAQFSAIVYENILLVFAALSYALLLAINLAIWPIPLAIAMAVIVSSLFIWYTPLTRWSSRVVTQISRWKLLKKLLGRLVQMQEGAPHANLASSAVLSRHQFFGYWICFLGSHFVMGIAFWLLLRSFGAGSLSVWYAAGTFATSWLLGLLSPLPGGLGVREGVLVYVLSLKLGQETALQISIIARLWNMMAELTFWVCIQLFSKLARKVRAYES